MTGSSAAGGLILVGLIACAGTAADEVPEGAASLESLLAPGAVLVLGEIHGTVEAPELVASVVELAIQKGLSVTVGLEIPRDETHRVDTFLESSGDSADRQALLAGRFWQSSYQDGRASEAMADLIASTRRLIADGKLVRVVLFDQAGARGASRERVMAEALAQVISAAPEDFTVVLTGNLHARLARGGGRGVSDPMALQVQHLAPAARVVSLNLSHSGGTAWMCGSHIPGGCGIANLAGRDGSGELGVELADDPDPTGYHGAFHLGPVQASLPAVDSILTGMVSSVASKEVEATLGVGGAALAARPENQAVLRDVGSWPQWMGPHGDGSIDLGLLPGRPVALELDWRRPIGDGHSSLTVLGDRVVTLEEDQGQVWVVTREVADGEELWRTALEAPARSAEQVTAGPLSTPAVDGERVFAIHPAGRLVALDLADGEMRWSRDLVAEFGATLSGYGVATSPVLADIEGGKTLYVQVGGGGRSGSEGGNLVGFDPVTGGVVRSVGRYAATAHASPAVGRIRSRSQIVVPAEDHLYGVDAAEGTILWSYPAQGDGERTPFPDRNPVILPDGRVFVAFSEHGAMFTISPETGEARELWRSKGLLNSYSPAAYYEGAIFGFGGNRLFCLDADSGATLWSSPVGEGSLVRVDDTLVVFNSWTGRLHLVEASREGFRERAVPLQVFPAGQYSPSPPSYGSGRIFVRGEAQIAAVRIAF